MAIKELFNDARPQVLFDPRASQRIDPRFKFTRDGVGTYTDVDGIIRYAPVNQPRFDHDPTTGESLGLLMEEVRTNSVRYSSELNNTSVWTASDCQVIPNSAIAPDGTMTADTMKANSGLSILPRIVQTAGDAAIRTLSIYAKMGTYQYLKINPRGDQYGVVADLSDGSVYAIGNSFVISADVISAGNGWYRVILTTSITSATGIFACKFSGNPNNNTTYDFTGDETIYLWGAQLETGSYPTSYIPTTSSTVTREPDLLSVETPLPSTGSIYIDARSLTSDIDATLLSAAPASPSTDKLALAIREPASLYNSKALVYEVDGQFKPTLPFPVPTSARERNLITYGANNYHYRSDSARLTPSSSDDVPANMTRLGIGHDVTDPTKAFNGYINAVYLWPGEITPTVAEALVRGDVDPKDADAGVFTPVAGSLAFVFNTQGTATDGDTVVQLPLRGSTNNVLVSWGDNTSSSLIGAAASVTVDHTYTSAGIYPVQIEADDDGTNSGLENLQFYGNSPADLARVLQWGGTTTFNPTTMYRAFRDCTQMDFESDARNNLPDTSGCSDWREAFYNCSSLSGQYPNFDHSGATQLSGAWYGCSSITSFSSSLDDLNSAGNFVTNYSNTWEGCSSITSFPTITIPNDQGDVNLTNAWNGCSNLNSFPAGIDTSAVTNFQYTWNNCSSLESFPLINTSSGTNFIAAWSGCSSLDNIANAGESTSFPLIDTSAGTSFYQTWRNCSSLTDFPANFFDSWSPTSVANQCFYQTWDGCSSLTPASVVNILDSIAASGQSAPTGTDPGDRYITIDWDGTGDPATDAATAITTLKSRNWQIYLNNVLQ